MIWRTALISNWSWKGIFVFENILEQYSIGRMAEDD
jgi:hypothetical protein